MQEKLLAAFGRRDPFATGKYISMLLRVVLPFKKGENDDQSSGKPITSEGGGSNLEACFPMEDKKGKQVLDEPKKALKVEK